MQRRDFLVTAAAGVVAAAGAIRPGLAQQAPAAPQGAPPAGGRGGPAGPLGSPASYPRSPKASRVAMMTLDFAPWVKDIPDVQPNPYRSMAFFDLPQMVADVYDVHLIEFQSVHFQDHSPAYYKSIRDMLAKSKSRATQINAEFGMVNMSAASLNLRSQAVALTKAWVDIAAAIGAQRVMVNQNQGNLTKDNLPQAIAAFKAMADYGKSKNIIVSIETRGNPLANRGRGAGAAAANPGAPPPPPLPENLPQPGLQTWQIMSELIKGAGAYSNPDVGNCNANSQQELHQCLSKELLFPTAGAMHCRVNTAWDLTTAIKYVTGLGYNGIFTAESNLGHEGNRPIYEAVLAAI